MHALVPLRGFASAKQRLAGLLAPVERERLAQAMITDVLAALASHPRLGDVVIVSDDPAAEWLARYFHVAFLPERNLGVQGLNAVLQAALVQLAAAGVPAAMILHGDLPLLHADDIDTLVTAFEGAGGDALVLSPDRVRQGSNALVTPLPSPVRLQYGSDSFALHQAEAAARGLHCVICDTPGTRFDIDTAEDLLALLAEPRVVGRGRATLKYLSDSGVAARLRAIAAGEANKDQPMDTGS